MKIYFIWIKNTMCLLFNTIIVYHKIIVITAVSCILIMLRSEFYSLTDPKLMDISL